MTRILFICHGNICRSPMAEFIFNDICRKKKLFHYAESAAMTSEEIGNPVYPPARRILSEHGISCKGKTARRIRKQDYDQFDMLIGMDRENMRHLAYLFPNDHMHKIHMFGEYSNGKEIDDPWYTGDFETCYDEILAGCEGLAEALK
ncbi:MAG: low molecular weight phosphotyrosine protein phosphatase [Solobacterium sp.]|nr:low molecular weight phosphotyrosine protein phosphatase [Solobacterium sp.]